MLKVLLTHDDALTCDGPCSALQGQRDIQVLAAVIDGREALDQAIRLIPDVVVTGASTPGMSGLEITRAISARKPEIAVLVLSNDPGSNILQAFQAGARGYLLETGAASELATAVRAVAKGERYLGSGVLDRMLDSFQATRSDVDALSRLSAMEHQILCLVADGKSNAEAAEILRLSTRTVETYRAGLMRKLGLDNVPSLVKFAIRQGIIALD